MNGKGQPPSLVICISAFGPKQTCRKLAWMSASEGSEDIAKSVSVLDL